MIFKFTFNAGLCSSSAQPLQRRYSSKARASPWRCATSTQMRLAGPFKRRRPRRSTRLRLPWSICGDLIRMMPSRQLVPPDTSFGFASEDDHLPDIISIFSCLFLPPLETGNLPKREATLLDSETRRSFSLPCGGSLFRCRPLVCAKGDLQVCRHHPLSGNLGKVLRLPATLPLDGARA